MFVVQPFVASLSVTNGYTSHSININKDGYTPIAIAGWSTPFGSAKCVGCYMSNGRLNIQMLAEGNGTGNFTYSILFVKL